MLEAGEALIRALDAGDVDRAVEYLAPDFVAAMHGIDVTYEEYGRDEWIEWYVVMVDLIGGGEDFNEVVAIDDGRVLGDPRRGLVKGWG